MSGEDDETEHGRRAEALRDRTKAYALRVIRFCRSLPDSDEGRVIRRQMLRSATSVAANYRAACRARSHREFVAKISVVLEEADETEFWIELTVDAGLADAERTRDLLREASELVAIFAASRRTAKRRS
ncbi:four helix bundle protein [Rubrivirga marina]|uniref:Four helix bundle protein n=1 Tax=Rubrivirga marina TaxID=1196024 RepID=A0A271J0B5_9BACT|nr:four helix bundle protein [Rubrivirga marina]PAP76757.1 hypothetical protein BSZ37_10085 [Rubrivirga marina]